MNTSLILRGQSTTIINGQMAQNDDELELLLKQAIVLGIMRAQGVQDFLSEEGYVVKCVKPEIRIKGHTLKMNLKPYKPALQSHEEWVKNMQIEMRGVLMNISGYLTGNLRTRFVGSAMQLLRTWDDLKQGEPVPSVEAPEQTPAPNA